MQGQIKTDIKIDGTVSAPVQVGAKLYSNTRISGTINSSSPISGQVNKPGGLKASFNAKDEMTGNIMETVLKGLSAYEIAVKNGYEGTEVEWLQSLVGDSVVIEVISDEKNEYILSLTVGNVTTITPNLKPVLVKGVDYLTESEVEELINDVTVTVKSDIDDTYQKKGEYIEGSILTVMELEDLLQ